MSTTISVVSTPDVLHGKPRLEGTRIGVFQLGRRVRTRNESPEAVADAFDLDAAEVTAAVEYYDEHPELMETLRSQHEAGIQSLREQSRA